MPLQPKIGLLRFFWYFTKETLQWFSSFSPAYFLRRYFIYHEVMLNFNQITSGSAFILNPKASKYWPQEYSPIVLVRGKGGGHFGAASVKIN